LYHFKRAWRLGAHAVVLDPPPEEPEPTRLHLVRSPGLGSQVMPPDEGSTKPASRRG